MQPSLKSRVCQLTRHFIYNKFIHMVVYLIIQRYVITIHAGTLLPDDGYRGSLYTIIWYEHHYSTTLYIISKVSPAVDRNTQEMQKYNT